MKRKSTKNACKGEGPPKAGGGDRLVKVRWSPRSYLTMSSKLFDEGAELAQITLIILIALLEAWQLISGLSALV